MASKLKLVGFGQRALEALAHELEPTVEAFGGTVHRALQLQQLVGNDAALKEPVEVRGVQCVGNVGESLANSSAPTWKWTWKLALQASTITESCLISSSSTPLMWPST